VLDVPVDQEGEHHQDEEYLHKEQGVGLGFAEVALF